MGRNGIMKGLQVLRLMLQLALMILCFNLVGGIENDKATDHNLQNDHKEFYRVEKSQWLDPHEFKRPDKKMESPQIADIEMKTQVLSCPKTDCDDCNKEKRHLERELKDCQHQSRGPDVKPYFLQFIRHFAETFENEGVNDGMYSVKVHLTPAQLVMLQRIGHSSSPLKASQFQDATFILVNMIQHVEAHNGSYVSDVNEAIERFTGLPTSLILQVLIACAAVLACIFYGMNIQMNWLRFFGLVILILFLVSIPWTWVHLYKKAVAKKRSDAMKHVDVPLECRPHDMSWQHSITSWLKDSFTFSDDKCTKYHEALMVDPFLEVPPTMAIAVATSRFLLQPFVHIGETVNSFFVASLKDLPLQMIPVVLIFILVVVVLLMLMMFGYSIRIPFLLSIRPRDVQALPIDTQQLREEIGQLTHQIQQMRPSLPVQETLQPDLSHSRLIAGPHPPDRRRNHRETASNESDGELAIAHNMDRGDFVENGSNQEQSLIQNTDVSNLDRGDSQDNKSIGERTIRHNIDHTDNIDRSIDRNDNGTNLTQVSNEDSMNIENIGNS